MDARKESEPAPMKNRTTAERKSEREIVVTRTFNGHELYPSKEALDANAGMENGMPETFAQLDELLVTLGGSVGRVMKSSILQSGCEILHDRLDSKVTKKKRALFRGKLGLTTANLIRLFRRCDRPHSVFGRRQSCARRAA